MKLLFLTLITAFVVSGATIVAVHYNGKQFELNMAKEGYEQVVVQTEESTNSGRVDKDNEIVWQKRNPTINLAIPKEMQEFLQLNEPEKKPGPGGLFDQTK